MKNAAEFERLADSLLYQSNPSLRRGSLNGREARSYESLQRRGLGSDDPTSTLKGVEQSSRIQVIRELAESKLRRADRGAPKDSGSERAPTSAVADVIPAFMLLRRGVASPPGMGSTILFMGLVAMIVVAMALAGLVFAVPQSSWALFQA
jgi:hypothetical protein